MFPKTYNIQYKSGLNQETGYFFFLLMETSQDAKDAKVCPQK